MSIESRLQTIEALAAKTPTQRLTAVVVHGADSAGPFLQEWWCLPCSQIVQAGQACSSCGTPSPDGRMLDGEPVREPIE